MRQFHVVAEPVALRRFGLALDELAEAVAANNGVAGGAFVERGGEQYVVRGDGWVRGAEDLEETVIAFRDGVPVLLSQVAVVELAPEIRQGAISRDGQGETVAGIVLMLRGGSGRDVVTGIKEQLEVARQSLPDDVDIVPFYDRSELVSTALGTVQKALLQGAVLVALVLLFFMGNLRSALVVALQLPMAALATFLVMGIFGMSSNLMTLSGLAIAIGMLGDGAIVLVENAIRLLGSRGGEDRRETVGRAAVEVMRPIVFGTAVIIVVFLPIASLQGMEGKMFAPLAFTISIALGCSLLLTMTVIPTLASLLLKAPATADPGRRSLHPADLVRRVYRPQLRWAVDHFWVVVGAGIGPPGRGPGLWCRPWVPSSFPPWTRARSWSSRSRFRRCLSISPWILSRGSKQAIMELPEVVHVVSRTGRSDISSDPMGVGESDVYVVLGPRSEWTTASTKAGLVDAIEVEDGDDPGGGVRLYPADPDACGRTPVGRQEPDRHQGLW